MPVGKMLELREAAITSILDVCYVNLDSVSVGPLCKQQPPSEDDYRCMILGSYTSFLMSLRLYPQRKVASEIISSVQKLSNDMSAVKICTYDSHNYAAIDEQIKDLRRKHVYTYQSFALPREKFIGHGITEHKTCGEVVTIGWRAKQICKQIPSAVLNEHTVHMAAQAKN